MSVMTLRLAVVLVAVAASALASEPVWTVVWEGGDATLDTSFATLNPPRMVSTGEVVFAAFLEGDGIGSGNDSTIWIGNRPTLSLICQEGALYPPAGAGVTALCPSLDAVVNGGSAAPVRVFGTSALAGAGVTSSNDTMRSMMVGSAGRSILVAREGSPAPGTDAVFDQAFGEHRATASGRVAFSGSLRAGSSASGIWAGSASAVALHVKAGDTAPGLGAAFQGFNGLSFSPSGYLIFRGYLATGAAGLYRGLVGVAPELVAGTGTVMPSGGTLLDVGAAAISRIGTAAFQGYLSVSSTGVWASSAAGLRTVAAPGQAAPDGGSFVAVGAPSIGGGDDICFVAQMSSGADGVYCELDGVLQLVVRESATPPALAPGETVGDVLWGPVVNWHGQVLFLSQVTSGGSFYPTWWLRDSSGQLRVLARVGTTLDIDPGGLVKTVSALDVPGGEYPRSLDAGSSSALNDRGEVVFLATFSDGSRGIFVARPELLDGPEVFADGFESGSTAGWSAAVG